MDPNSLRHDLLRLRDRLRGLVALHGGLAVLAAAAGLLLVLFVLDRALSLPAPMRLLLLAGAATALGALLWRGLLRPLRIRIRAEDVACAVEERFPEFDGRLISTLELEGEALAPDRNVSLALVERLRRETGVLRGGVRLEAIFGYRSLKRLALAALLLALVDVGFVAARPDLAGIFFARLCGLDRRWPQDTFLTVELAREAEHFTVEFAGDHPATVRIARGASLPVIVRHRGERPRFVELRSRGTARHRLPPLALSPTAADEWVGRFRNVREAFEFWPHDGDPDDDGRPVQVEVFVPPGVAAVAAALEFPAYTGLEPRVEARGEVEAPEGTRVELRVTLSGEVASGRVVFDTGGRELPLAPPAAAAPAGPDAPAEPVWTASFEVVESCSYTIHLLGRNGFANLEPASHAVIAVKDRAPTVRLLEPARANLDVTPQGLVPFRVAADDDYGVRTLEVALKTAGAEAARALDLLGSGPDSGNVRRRLAYALLDLGRQPFTYKDGERASQVGDSFFYEVAAEDNRQGAAGPEPNRSAVAERRVDVVSVNEKLRLLTERQIRLKDDVRQLREAQFEKIERLRGTLTDYEASEGDRQPDVDDLAALEIGQNQITNRTTRLCRDFADLFEEYLLNRLDPSAAAERLVPLLAERKRASTVVDAFDFAVYRPLARQSADGAFGALDVLGRLLEMLLCALDVAEILSPEAARAVSDARLLVDAEQRPERIRAALDGQQRALARLDQLLEKMDEWEDFQEILSLFRDLIEDQRDLNVRTRDAMRSGPR